MLHVSYATTPAPGALNEDYVIAGPTWAAVLDGATAPKGVESGCIHDVRWLVQTLAISVAATIETPQPLDHILREAITATMRAHETTCDLGNPNSPSSTISIVRRSGDHLDYLVLCDSPIAIQRNDGTLDVIDDDRTAHLPGGRPYSLELVQSLRNQPGGFWVASTTPHAAEEALTGSVPVARVKGVGMFTDGVTRLIEWYGHSWADITMTAAETGPVSLLTKVRDAERTQGTRGPGKPHDDATAAWIEPIRVE